MTMFDAHEEEGLLKNIVGKGENAGNQHVLLFPQFSSLSQTKLMIGEALNLSSANAFNFERLQFC